MSQSFPVTLKLVKARGEVSSYCPNRIALAEIQGGRNRMSAFLWNVLTYNGRE